jgi:hypothetical protein
MRAALHLITCSLLLQRASSPEELFSLFYAIDQPTTGMPLISLIGQDWSHSNQVGITFTPLNNTFAATGDAAPAQ